MCCCKVASPCILHQFLVSTLLQPHIEADKPPQSLCKKPAAPPNITPKTVYSITNPQLSLLPNSSHSCYPCHLHTSPCCPLCIHIVSWWGKKLPQVFAGGYDAEQLIRRVLFHTHPNWPRKNPTHHSMSPIFRSH